MKTPTKKNAPFNPFWMQSMIENMGEAELAGFQKFLEKPSGDSAKVWVLKNAIRKAEEAKAPAPPTVKKPTEKEQLARLFSDTIKRRLMEIQKVTCEKCAVDKIDSQAFMAALYALYGKNDFFGDQAAEAIRTGNVEFFTAAAEAIKASTAHMTEKENRLLSHLTVALIHLEKELKKGGRKITKQKLQQVIETKIQALGMDAFSDKGSWQKLWKRPELSPFLKQEHVGRKSVAGKGREVDVLL